MATDLVKGVQIAQMDLVLVMMGEIGKQYPAHPLIARHMNAVIDAANSVVREFAKGEIDSVPGSGIEAWRKTDQVGKSSDYMACILSGRGMRVYAYPSDPSDFGRCLKLLEAAPELREKLGKMADCGREWIGLVAHWEALESLYAEEYPTGKAPKTYALIQKAIKQK